MKNITLIAAASLCLGGGLGYMIGQTGASAPEQTAATLQESARSSRSECSRSSLRQVSRESRMNEVLARPGQTDRLQGMLDLYDQLSPEEFEKEAERLRNLPGAERFIGAFLLYSKWGEVDPLGAMDHIGKLGMVGMMVRPIALQGWAGSDPAGAVAYYEENKSSFGMMRRFGGGSSPAATIAGEWARQDPEAALAWAGTLEGNERAQATSSVFSNLAMSDPVRAAQMTAGLSEPEERLEAVREVAKTWAVQDWDASQEWIQSLPASQQSAAQTEAVIGLAQSQPRQAAEEVLNLPEGEGRQGAVVQVAQNLAMEAPDEAAGWLMQHGNESSQADAIGPVMRNWAATDEAAARAFIDGQAEGAVRDRATASYVTSSSAPPEERLELASGIGDERLQRRTIMRTAGQWSREDPEAASQWIDSQPNLDEGMRERLKNGRGGGWFGGGRR